MASIDVGQLVQKRFRILKHLGRGNQADVFQAKDVLLSRLVAIKQYLYIDQKEKRDIAYIDKEAELLQKIKNPNIMHCYQLIKLPQLYLVILEYIDGMMLTDFIQQQFQLKFTIESLIDVKELFKQLQPIENSPNLRYQYQSIMRKILKDQIIENQGQQQIKLLQGFSMSQQLMQTKDYHYVDAQCDKFELQDDNMKTIDPEHPTETNTTNPINYYETVQQLFSQILNVLVQLDKLQIMHRDLKPDNIMITKGMIIKLIDFGICKDSKNAKTIVGTQGFQAPEMMEMKTVGSYTNKIDVWSAGVIFYYMLFGYQPFLCTKYYQFEIMQATKGLYLPPYLLGENQIDNKYIEAIEAALTVDPSERASAEKLQEILGLKQKAQSSKPVDLQIKVVLAGEYKVGKTTILKKMAKSTSTQQIQILHRQITVDNLEVMHNFYDTLGTEQSTCSQIPQIMRNVNMCFLTYSLQNLMSYENLVRWYEMVSGCCEQEQICKQKYYYLSNDFGGTIEARIKEDEIKDQKMRFKNYDCCQDTDFDTILFDCVREYLKSNMKTLQSKNKDQKRIVDVEKSDSARGCC